MLVENIVKRELIIPEGVKVEVSGLKVIVEGPRGRIEKDFSHASEVGIRTEDNKVIVEGYGRRRKHRAIAGTILAHIRNMIIGVTRGYRYKLKIISSHFPISVEQKGNFLLIKNFLGEKSYRKAKILPGVKVKIEKEDIILEGIDIDAVSQTAANIEQATKVKEFDRRVFMDGIYIYEKGEAS